MRAQLAILVVFVGAADTGRPTVATSEATALGTTAMSMNGTVHPHALPTTCHFEYGPTPVYGSKTAEQPLPPRLAAYYHESWDEGLGGWQTWLQATHHTSGGPSGGYVNFFDPRDRRSHDVFAAGDAVGRRRMRLKKRGRKARRVVRYQF